MRKLLVLAFLLYDIVAIATRLNNYDYDDIDGPKGHPLDDRRNWRKKALSKGLDDHRDWERKRYEYDNPRYIDEMESKMYNGIDRQREMDPSPGYRYRRYEEADKMSLPSGVKSSEVTHSFLEKESEKKLPLEMSCQRPHEKYESCFAGCASVTCDNPRDRMQPCYPFCEGGCVCVHPYVRDDRTHKCVLPEECTKMQPCYPFCEGGCVCVHPYVRDDRTHKCVLPEECTKGLKGIPDLGEEAATQ